MQTQALEINVPIATESIIPSDEELMLLYAQGDLEAFDQLFHRHKSTVYSFIHKFVYEKELADDLFQNVFIRIIRNRNRYEPKAKFSTWLYTIARSECIDHLRRVKKNNIVPLFPCENDSQPVHLDREASNPRDVFVELEHQRLIDEALQQIPAEQREVLLLREMTDLTFEEIAKLTGCPLNTVKSRMHYALLAMRRLLQNKGIRI